jgi:hypothetical protein
VLGRSRDLGQAATVASPVVEGPQAEIRRNLAPDGCKFQSGEAHVFSGESRALFEFKLKVDETAQSKRNFIKFKDIYII